MRILLYMTCIIITSCMISKIDASMQNSLKSLKNINTPTANRLSDQHNSDDTILYLRLPAKRKILNQDSITDDLYNKKLTELQNKKSHMYSGRLRNTHLGRAPHEHKRTVSFYSLSQDTLQKAWNHPSVQELTLDKISKKDTTLTSKNIERKTPFLNDSFVDKKSKNSQKVDCYVQDAQQYSNKFFESDEIFSDQVELALLENYILDNNHQSLPEQQHVSVDYVDEHSDQNFNFDTFDNDLCIGTIDKHNDTVRQSSYNQTDQLDEGRIEKLLLDEYLDSLIYNDTEK